METPLVGPSHQEGSCRRPVRVEGRSGRRPPLWAVGAVGGPPQFPVPEPQPLPSGLSLSFAALSCSVGGVWWGPLGGSHCPVPGACDVAPATTFQGWVLQEAPGAGCGGNWFTGTRMEGEAVGFTEGKEVGARWTRLNSAFKASLWLERQLDAGGQHEDWGLGVCPEAVVRGDERGPRRDEGGTISPGLRLGSLKEHSVPFK